jgi:glycosyltransferase involved in cell wall biosynthesis
LRACDELLVIDHGSTDNTVEVARDLGATVKEAVPGVNPGVYAIDARHDWILCLLPTESLSEALEASLFEWKHAKGEKSDQGESDAESANALGVSVRIREETGNGWKELPAETRLVNRKKVNWPGQLPANDPGAPLLEGPLLRFGTP